MCVWVGVLKEFENACYWVAHVKKVENMDNMLAYGSTEVCDLEIGEQEMHLRVERGQSERW